MRRFRRVKEYAEECPSRQLPPTTAMELGAPSTVGGPIKPMSLEFTTTAMRRPEIIKMAYESFTENLTGIDWGNSTLYINIDPLPEGSKSSDVVDVAKEFFGNVAVRSPSVPNFTRAVQWLWSQVKGPYVFHLEDDWVLNCEIRIEELVAKILEDDACVQCSLRPSRKYTGYINKVSLSPSLLDGNFVRMFYSKFNLDVNPEVQLRSVRLEGGRSTLHKPDELSVTDIGRSWLRSSEYKRPSKRGFVTWERKGEV